MDRDNSLQLTFDEEPYDEFWAGLFIIDRWHVTKQWDLEAQLRGDYYSETHADWSTRLSALYALDEQKKHTVRISAAKAFRSPLSVVRQSEFPPVLLKADDPGNEEIQSVELGYIGHLTKNITFQADSYYQRYRDLIGMKTISPGPPFPRMQMATIDGADALGAEVQIKVEGRHGKISTWYAYNDFQPDQEMQSIRAYGPAKHKAGLSGRLYLPDGWTLNGNYKYCDTTPGYPEGLDNVNHYNSFDLTLAKSFANDNAEFMIGVNDILDQTDLIVKEGNGFAHETPGRNFFARIQYKF
jgi:outer membrane receptor protein involved in Fe transport